MSCNWHVAMLQLIYCWDVSCFALFCGYWYAHNISLRCYSVIFEIPRWILSVDFIGEKSYFAALCSRASYPFVCYLTKALGSEPRHKLQMSLFSKIYWSIVQRKWKENTHQVCPQFQNRVNRDKGEKYALGTSISVRGSLP